MKVCYNTKNSNKNNNSFFKSENEAFLRAYYETLLWLLQMH